MLYHVENDISLIYQREQPPNSCYSSFLKNIDVFLALSFCIKLVHQIQKMRKLPTALVHYFYIYPLFSVILGIIF